ncbi:MAG TPA: S41 family peptidase [Steroidobacteraceae bacterium]|nr:S41 family peptidase [Steroidobacteraceae bacterium]
MIHAALAGNAIPTTPAGNALRSWLSAFNSGESARIESFDQTHAPWLTLDGMMQLRARTGGYDLLSIQGGGDFWIVFRIRERKTSAEVIGSIVVRSYEPGHVTLLSLAPAGAHSTEANLDGAERARVISGAAKLLDEYYLYPDVARKVSAKLKALQRHGEYRDITDGDILATRLGDDLVELSGDKHIGVDFFAKTVPGPAPARDPRWLAASNCGFEQADHFPPNIGYLKLTAFDEPEYCTRTAIAAMNFLADSDALIIDLRDSHGGAPRMAALIASYLFAKRTHFDDIDYPTTHHAEHLWTLPNLPGKKFTGKPVFVLTASSTFSASEEFAYDLQSLKRATVVGETTGGGAHVMAPHRIDNHFVIRVPFARFVNPITKMDWEGTGVEPDVKVSAAEALAVAEKLAAEEIGKAKLHQGSSATSFPIVKSGG